MSETASYAHVERIIHDWIRDDVPLAAKMNLHPKHVASLIDRLTGSKTRANPTPNTEHERDGSN